jgi:hypothetical protein
MATAIAPSIVLGEPPDRLPFPRFLAARRAIERLQEEVGDREGIREGTERTGGARRGDREGRVQGALPATVRSASRTDFVPSLAAPPRQTSRLDAVPLPSTPLPLEPGLSLEAVAERLEGAPGEVVLVDGADLAPELQARLPLALLRRRAARRGKRLLLETGSSELRRLALATGLETVRPGHTPPAAPSPNAFERSTAAPSSGPAPRAAAVTLPARPVAVAMGVALLALLLAWALLPAAEVRLTATTEGWSVALPVEVDPGLQRPDVARGRLPGRTISKEVADSATAPATGRRVVPDSPASGEVVFVNKTNKAVSVPKGTAVSAGGVRFLTQGDVTVAATVGSGNQQRIGMGRAKIAAATGGPAGNVERYRIDAVEGPLGPALDVQNDLPTRGGTEKTVTLVTADDRRRLQDSLQQRLTDRLMQQVRQQLPAPDKETAIPWAGQNPAVVEATFSKNADEQAQSVSLTLKLRYGATVFGNDAYNALVRQMATARVGQGMPGFQVVPQTLRPEPPEVAGMENGLVRLNGRASAAVEPRLDAGDLRRALANRPLAEARAYLGTLPGVGAAAVQTSPGWLGRLPWLWPRIAVVVERTSAAPAAPPGGAGQAQQWRSAPNGP